MKNLFNKTNKTGSKYLFALIYVFFVGLVYFFGNPYVMHIVIIGGIYSFMAIGLNIVTGLCGQINLGMAGFYAIGSYTSALLATKLGVSFWISFPLAIILSAVAGFIIGYPALKVRGGVYLVLVTVSFASLIQTIITQWVSLTNGPMGVIGIPRPSIFGFTFKKLNHWLILIYLILALALLIALRVEKSRIGRSFKAIRESDTSAVSLGINISYYKILAFVMSAAFGGAGGALYAHYMTTVSPDIYSMSLSVLTLTMIVIGGVGAIKGSILGGVLVAVIPEALRFLGQYQLVVWSLIVVVIAITLKRGLLGAGLDAVEFFKKAFVGRSVNEAK